MKEKKLLKYLGIAAVVLIIFAIVAKKVGWVGKSQLLKVVTEKAMQRTIVEVITANGKIQPETEIKISSDVSGEIVELHVKEGEQVKQGDLLLKIKPDIYLSNLERMKAAVNSAKSNLANARARLTQAKAGLEKVKLAHERNKQLWEKKAISQAEYESSLSSFISAEADVEAATQTVNSSKFSVESSEASLKEAKENLLRTSIYAPLSGTVSKLNVEQGERVVGTIQMTGTELMRIANLNRMEVIVEVNENDIVRVEMKDTCIIELDAYMDDKFAGLVTEIANSANTVGTSADQITNFNVKILILPQSYRHLIPAGKENYYPFRPGMSATVDIQTETKYNIITVPIQAVTMRADSTQIDTDKEKKELEKEEKNTDEELEKEEELEEVVFIYREGAVYKQKVKSGVQDNNYIEIIEGLTIDDKVVTAPYSAISKKLKHEKKVEKVDKDKLY